MNASQDLSAEEYVNSEQPSSDNDEDDDEVMLVGTSWRLGSIHGRDKGSTPNVAADTARNIGDEVSKEGGSEACEGAEAMGDDHNDDETIYHLSPAKSVSQTRLRDRIRRKYIDYVWAKDQRVPTDRQVESYIFKEEKAAMSYVLPMEGKEAQLIRHYVWEKGLVGKESRLLNQLYRELGLPAMAAARHEKVKNRIWNTHKTMKAVAEMVETDQIERVERRLALLQQILRERPGE